MSVETLFSYTRFNKDELNKVDDELTVAKNKVLEQGGSIAISYVSDNLDQSMFSPMGIDKKVSINTEDALKAEDAILTNTISSHRDPFVAKGAYRPDENNDYPPCNVAIITQEGEFKQILTDTPNHPALNNLNIALVEIGEGSDTINELEKNGEPVTRGWLNNSSGDDGTTYQAVKITASDVSGFVLKLSLEDIIQS